MSDHDKFPHSSNEQLSEDWDSASSDGDSEESIAAEYSEAPSSRKKRTAASCLGIPMDCSVVSLDVIGKLLQRRPDLFDYDWVYNRGRAVSTIVKRDDFFNVYEAVNFANYRSYVLNFSMTVDWQRGGYYTPDDVDIAFVDFIERFRKFCAYWKVPAIYYAVFENGPTIGYHSHIHLHFPHSKQKQLVAWMKASLTGADGEPFPSGFYEYERHKDDHVIGQWLWFRYSMKGLDPSLLKGEKEEFPPGTTFNSIVGVDRKPPGPVLLKRVRLSRVIGAKAQKLAQYTPPYMTMLPRDQWYSDREYRRGRLERDTLPPIEML